MSKSLASLLATYKAGASAPRQGQGQGAGQSREPLKRDRDFIEKDKDHKLISKSSSNDKEAEGDAPAKRMAPSEPTHFRASTFAAGIQDPPMHPPHYMILGAQKAGTMAAVKNLNRHPEIFCLKEPHYFDLGWHSKSPLQYRKLFQGTGKRILGEKTPELIYVDECAPRMKTVVPVDTTKFILFLRDPLSRAFSAWNMNINRGFDTNPFSTACEMCFKNLNEHRSYGTAEFHYVQRGFYLDQILRFLKVFPKRENLMIVVAEHMRDPMRAKQIYGEIFEFLGAKPFDFEPEEEHVGSYAKGKSEMSSSMELKLMQMYEAHNERLFQWLGFRIEEWSTVQSVRAKVKAKELTKEKAAAAQATATDVPGVGVDVAVNADAAPLSKTDAEVTGADTGAGAATLDA